MKRALVFLAILLAAGWMGGCKSSSAPSATGKPPADAVEQKMQELAGKDATNCGRPAQGGDLKGAADCALQASAAKKAFYVAYDLPGLTVGVAGAAGGKMYTVQAETSEGGGVKQVTSADCPAAARVAQSGRVTCVSPGSMGVMGGGANPHGGIAMPPGGGMTMPPASGASPHGGMAMPPPGTPNPHAGGAPMEGAPSH
jgi:hypothetical protein